MTGSAIAATLFGPEDLRVTEHPLGPLAPGMVRVRFGAGGICGSDLHYFRHARTGDFVVTSPLILGHEVAGEIVEINAAVSGLAIGDRVAVNPSRWCGHCARCAEGRANLCENIYFMGSASKTPHMQGRFRQRLRRHAGAMRQGPAACGLSGSGARRAARRQPARRGASRRDRDKSVIVFGAGPIGLLTMLAARLKGCGGITSPT